MSEQRPWTPGRGEQRVLWWSRFVLRWIGAVGLTYTALVEHDPIGMIMFTITGLGVDVGTLVATLIRIGREEAKAIERSVEQDYQDPSRD